MVLSGECSPRQIETIHGSISDHRIYENAEIVVDDDLTVEVGGWLDISNSKMTVLTDYNGSTNIAVNGGGTLTIINTTLQSNTSFAYTLRLLQDSNVLFLNAEIRNCGFICYTYDFNTGIWSQTNNFTIIKSSIYFEGTGIITNGGLTTLNDTYFYPNLSVPNGKISWNGPLASGNIASYNINNSSFIGRLGNFAGTYTGQVQFGDAYPSHAQIRNSTFDQVWCLLYKCSISNSTFYNDFDDGPVGTMAGKNGIIENSIIQNNNSNGDGLLFYDGIFNVTNSTIIAGRYGVRIGYENAKVTTLNLLNTSLSLYRILSNYSHIKFSNFLNLAILSEKTSIGLENVSVKIYDPANKPVFSGKSGPEGRILYIPLLWNDVTNIQTTTTAIHRIVLTWNNATKSVENVDMSTMQNLTIIFDDIPPLLNITYPPDNLMTNSSLISIAGTTDSDAHVTLNDQSITNNNGIISQGWWLNEENNTLDFQARDPAGNMIEVIRNVTLDTIGPSVTITEPQDKIITNQNPIIIKGITNGTKVEIDGKFAQLNPNGTFDYNYSFTHEGQYSIVATAWDIADNSEMARVRVEYDITPPGIEISTPPNGTYTHSPSVEVKGRILGASDATLDDQVLRLDSSGDFIQTVSLASGINIITIWAKDIAGNQNTTSVIVYLDTSIFLNITDPPGDLLVNVSSATISGITDSDATVTIGDKSAENKGGNFSRVVQLEEGLNKVTVVSTDRAGNRAEKTVRITVDTIAPEINLLAPPDNPVKDMDIELKIRSEAGAMIKVNGVSINGTGDIYTYQTVLEKGDNTFTITAQDPAGNINSTVKVITYVPPKPSEPKEKTENGLLLPIIILVVIAAALLAAYIVLMKKRTKV